MIITKTDYSCLCWSVAFWRVSSVTSCVSFKEWHFSPLQLIVALFKAPQLTPEGCRQRGAQIHLADRELYQIANILPSVQTKAATPELRLWGEISEAAGSEAPHERAQTFPLAS